MDHKFLMDLKRLFENFLNFDQNLKLPSDKIILIFVADNDTKCKCNWHIT